MIKFGTILTLLTLFLASCGETKPVNDPLNLFNDKPATKIEGGTEQDPLNLFGSGANPSNR